MPEPLDARRRRALYRATHRGTKELDFMVGRFATARIASMSEAVLADFERMLSVPDPEIDFWLRGGGEGEAGEFSAIIASMRTFLLTEPLLRNVLGPDPSREPDRHE